MKTTFELTYPKKYELDIILKTSEINLFNTWTYLKKYLIKSITFLKEIMLLSWLKVRSMS